MAVQKVVSRIAALPCKLKMSIPFSTEDLSKNILSPVAAVTCALKRGLPCSADPACERK